MSADAQARYYAKKRKDPEFIERRNEITRRHRERHPDAYHARNVVSSALRRGKLVRPQKCDECKKRCKPEAHHDDYSKPLEVRWLCTDCHGKKRRN